MLSMDGWCFVTLLRPWYQYINMRNTDFHTIDVTTNTRNGHVTPKLGFLQGGFFQQMRGRPPPAIRGCNCWPIFSSQTDHQHCPLYFDRGPLSCNFGVFFVVSHVFSTQKQSSKLNTPRSWRSRVFHFGTWKTLVGWRGHPRSAKLKTCRITRSCRLGWFRHRKFQVGCIFCAR